MQGRKCSICQHPLRAEIEKAALDTNAYAAAAKYGVGYDAVRRHTQLHYQRDRPVYLPPVFTPDYVGEKPNEVVVADQRPTNIPNAYRQLDDLRVKLFKIIDAPDLGKEAAEWVVVQDKQYRLGAMRELRATITATLKLWEAQRALEERFSGSRPLQASMIAAWLADKHPEVLEELVGYLRGAEGGGVRRALEELKAAVREVLRLQREIL